MYLKRLEITGFKSFVNRTVFDFGPGLTAIVGPSIRGKTEIVDALTLVLGTDSGKFTRAQAQADILPKRSARNTGPQKTEVTVVIDNGDRRLLADGGEVRITRRLTSSGESAYFIDRHRASGQQVAALFDISHRGSAYASLGAGLIDKLIDGSPEERRLLIEEAADLHHYRFKLAEAQEHLKATRENMTRIRLLLTELQPTVARLEEQASRAARRQTVESELNAKLRAWHIASWRQAAAQLSAAQNDLKTAVEAAERAKDAYCLGEGNLENLQALLAGLRNEEARNAKLIRTARERLALLVHRASVESQRVETLNARLGELYDDMVSQQAEHERVAQALADSEDQADSVQQAIISAGETIVLIGEQYDTAFEEVTRRRAELDAADRELFELQSALARTQGRFQSWHEAQSIRLQEDSESEGKEALFANLIALARTYAELKSHLAGVERDKESLFDRSQYLERLVTEQRSRLDARRQQLHQLTLEIERSRGRLDALKEEARPAALPSPDPDESNSLLPAVPNAADPPALRSEMSQASRQGLFTAIGRLLSKNGPPVDVQPEWNTDVVSLADVPGGLATLSELIQVPSGLEKAITTALADKSNALLVQTRKEAIAVAEHIAERGSARTILVPVDDVQTVYPPNLLREPGVIGIASELVRCPEDYRYLVNALLGRIIVVDNVEVAQRVLRRGLGSVVTCDGIMIHPSGVVESGRGTPVFKQRRELATIPRRIRRMEQQRVALSEEMNTLIGTISQHDDDLEGLSQRYTVLDRRESALQTELASCRQQIGRTQGKIRVALAAEKAVNLRAEKAGLERRLKRLASAATAAEERVTEEQDRLIAAGQRLEALTQEMAAARAQLASLKDQEASLGAVQQSYRDFLANLDAQLEAKVVQRAAAEEEAETLNLRLGRLRKAVANLTDWLTPRETIQRDIAVEISGREGDLMRQKTEIASAGEELSLAEERRRDVEATVRQRQTEVEALRREMEVTPISPAQLTEAAVKEERVRIPEWLAAQPPEADASDDVDALKGPIEALKTELRNIGSVSPDAAQDYQQAKERRDSLMAELDELSEAERTLSQGCADLERSLAAHFDDIFQRASDEFARCYAALFEGGRAKLALTPARDGEFAGVNISARPAGKRAQKISALSGSDKALTAAALLFALLRIKPLPLCVLNQPDAGLDETSAGRFVDALRELAERTQLIVVTHKRRVMEAADRLYGITTVDKASTALSLELIKTRTA